MTGDIAFVLWCVLRFVGYAGGLLVWGFLLWLYCSRHGGAIVRAELRRDDECRCRQCEAADHCPAAFAGVVYPCPYYAEKEDGP